MAEAFAAVALASAVVQFVDFALTVVSKGNEYRKSATGALPEHQRLEFMASKLNELSQGLDESLGTLALRPALSREEAALQNIVRDCQKASCDLIGALQRLQGSGHATVWKSSRQALKSIWAQDDIEKRHQTLRDARSQVVVHLLVVLSQRSERKFQTLIESNSATIAEIQGLRSEVSQDYRRLVSAIETVRRDTPLNVEIWRQAEDDRRPDLYVQQSVVVTREMTQREKETLSSLVFPKITERYNSISKAHVETFNWIFEESQKNSTLWTNIVEWFRDQESSPIYWVSGKPGSGKSTFMRYLSDNNQNGCRTQDNLMAWANHRKLLKASCFFWAAGTPMQKSIEGLIQSLLYELCYQDPDQLSKLPSRRQTAGPSTLAPWTSAELKTALETIIKTSTDTHAICLFVDGLDEFEGTDKTREDLVQFFQNLAKSSNIKICLSSRPWLVFKDSFEQGPSLRLEDLTREDIRNYVKKELEEHSRFLQLKVFEPEQCTSIISEITEKAEGVFLWVILVVRSLLQGLRNEDSSVDLLRRLAAIPSDLEEYFHLIINSIEPFYFPQSCQVFQMVMEAKIDLSLPTLIFANDEDWFESATSIRDTSADHLAQQLLSMRRRLNVLCKGLLEVHERERHNTMFQFSVDFLHRTVHDFLWLPEVKDKIDNGTPRDFDAHMSLGQAYLAQIVLLDKEGAITTGFNSGANIGDLMKLTDSVLSHALAIEQLTHKAPGDLVKILGETLDSISSANNWEVLTTSHAEYPKALLSCGPEFWVNWALWQNSFLSLTISSGLKFYTLQQLQLQPDLITKKTGRPLLDYALRRGFEASKPFRKVPDIDVVKLMLQQGADPNEKWQGSTIWGLFLECLQKGQRPIAPAWCEVAELLIEFGAHRSAFVSHAKMIPARRMNSGPSWSISDNVDPSATPAGKGLSIKSRTDAVAVLSGLGGKDAKRLATILKKKPAQDNAMSSTESLPEPASTNQKTSKIGLMSRLSRLFRSEKKR